MLPTRIAVLGGGLTGLSSAFHLSRRFPKAKIILLEKTERLGGWVRSERVELPQTSASVLLEAGPRSLRPNSKAVLELIHLLKLEEKVITVHKTAPPAKARFLYIPKSGSSTQVSGLQRIPSSILSVLFSPLLPILLPAILFEPFKRANRDPGIDDESVHSLFARRFGETFARLFGSAMVHGIYATDSRKLSIRAAFPSVWEAENRGRGSIVRGFFIPGKKDGGGNYDLGNMLEMMRHVSVYSFKDGMETLTRAIEKNLLSSTNVSIVRNIHVSALKQLEDHSLEVLHSQGEPLRASHVVSALPLPILHNLVSGLPHLTVNPSSTVRVVNFVFPSPPKDIHPAGFGYLIPRPPTDYPTASQGVLGTVFDSCSLHEQDTPPTEDYYNNATHTKLTMMTGGPYPKPPLPSFLNSTETDTIPPFIRSLLEELKVQLGRDLPDPIYWRVWNNEACIPTLLPGHLDRMEKLEASLLSPMADGRLAVVGAGVGGVSVGDCVEAGRQVGRDWI